MKLNLNIRNWDTHQKQIFLGLIIMIISLFLTYEYNIYLGTIKGYQQFRNIFRILLLLYPAIASISTLNSLELEQMAVFLGAIGLWTIWNIFSVVRNPDVDLKVGYWIFLIGLIIYSLGVLNDLSSYEIIERRIK